LCLLKEELDAHPLRQLVRSIEFVAGKIIIITSCVNSMAGRVEGNMGKYAGGGGVTA
jgi:hypothetical protein